MPYKIYWTQWIIQITKFNPPNTPNLTIQVFLNRTKPYQLWSNNHRKHDEEQMTILPERGIKFFNKKLLSGAGIPVGCVNLINICNNFRIKLHLACIQDFMELPQLCSSKNSTGNKRVFQNKRWPKKARVDSEWRIVNESRNHKGQ